MTDYTELVEALRYCVSGVCKNCSYFEKCKKNGTAMAQLHDDAADAIEALQAQLPKHGEWVKKEGKTSYWYVCSECGNRPLKDSEEYSVFSDFCPSCGADMRTKMEVQE